MAGTIRHRPSRGQVLPLALIVLLLAGLLALGVARLGAAVARGEAAQAAADAAALAGAARGEEAARSVAHANRAELIDYRTDGSDVVVTVDRAGVERSARARWVPDTASPGMRPPDPVHLPGA